MSARSATVCYGTAIVSLAAAVFGLPAWSPLAWGAVGVLSAVAVLVGIRRHAPGRPWPWRLLAVAILMSAAGGVFSLVLTEPSPRLASVGDPVLFFAMFPAAAAALLGLARSGSAIRDRAGVVDAVTVTVAAVLLAWVCLVNPYLSDASGLHQSMIIAFPLGAMLQLAIVVRLSLSRPRTASVGFLAVGSLAAVVAGTMYAVSLATGSLATGSRPWGDAIALGWLTFYAAWGAAGLHPSMARLTQPEPLRDRQISVRRRPALALTSLVVPAVLLVESLVGEVRDGILLAVASATIILLNLASMADAANTHGRSLAHREHHDTLTGLANRSLFASRLREAVARSRGGGPAAGVILIDLDDFKLLNDTLGQSAGDEVLVAVAWRLARTLGRHDLAARFGGDEFAVLVDAAVGPDEVEAFADRVLAALAEPIAFAGKTVTVTASIGVSATDADADALDGDPLSQAGLALRAARAGGRGQWRRYRSDVYGAIIERMRLRTALGRAVVESAFMLAYQPIVALDSGETVGFEALVRWEHPTRGLVGPAEFIDLAEEAGQIEPIGEWVLRRAVTAAAHWHRARPPGPYVSVNVSAHQLRRPGFAERVDRELATAGLPPSHLMMELTESVLLREDDAVWAELAALRDTGVRLALDDFGTGFSSLSYLVQTPIDIIKIDKSFIGALSSTRQRLIVDGIVRLADTLGLQVVAEGIETAADRDLLAGMGCPFGQGFLYSVPLTSAEATRWITGAAGPRPGTDPGAGEKEDATDGGTEAGACHVAASAEESTSAVTPAAADEYVHSGAAPAERRTLPT